MRKEKAKKKITGLEDDERGIQQSQKRSSTSRNMKPLEVWTCQRAENLKKKSSKIPKNNYAAKMVSAGRPQKIIGGGGGGAPINKSRRRRSQIVGGGAARPAHSSTPPPSLPITRHHLHLPPLSVTPRALHSKLKSHLFKQSYPDPSDYSPSPSEQHPP